MSGCTSLTTLDAPCATEVNCSGCTSLKWASSPSLLAAGHLPNWGVVVYRSGIVQIGCQRHYVDEWAAMSDENIAKMHERALAWWREHKGEVLGKAREWLGRVGG